MGEQRVSKAAGSLVTGSGRRVGKIKPLPPYLISWGKAPHDATPQPKCKHQQLRQKLADSYANYTNIIADL
jgi:hypothetical protein